MKMSYPQDLEIYKQRSNEMFTFYVFMTMEKIFSIQIVIPSGLSRRKDSTF